MSCSSIARYSERRDWTWSTSSEAIGRDLSEFPPFQRIEDAHRFDGVLVHGENMVGIELHLADDAGPIRQIPAKKTRLVQDAEPVGLRRDAVRPGDGDQAPCHTANR